MAIGCEIICYRGYGVALNQVSGTGVSAAIGNYIHDCSTGVIGGVQGDLINNIIASCSSKAIDGNADNGMIVYGNTIYGAENKLGIGINTPSISTFLNNIIDGFVSGFGGSATTYAGYSDYNCFNNNTNNINATDSGAFFGANDLTTTNPSFTSVTQRTGATATTTSGNHLVQSAATFQTWGITAGVDCVYIKSGTGVTAGIYGILSVDSETQITVDVTLTANATADKVWQITQGHNFLPTGAI